MENRYRKKIHVRQEYKGRTILFDPDSSPKAWDYYKLVYKENFGDSYKIETPVFCEYIGFNKGLKRGDKYYNYYDKVKYSENRLYALIYNGEEIEENGINYYYPSLRLGGEVDFNFNSKHAPYFEWLLSSIEDDERREKLLQELEKCIEMHHTAVNFSLMQVTGNLQGFKGGCCEDRVDKFLFFLKRYYESSNKEMTAIARYSTSYNRGSLIEYLNGFVDVYEYCLKVYLIEDREFIDKLINNGKKKIDNADDVEKYIELANEFWNRKESYIREQTCI